MTDQNVPPAPPRSYTFPLSANSKSAAFPVDVVKYSSEFILAPGKEPLQGKVIDRAPQQHNITVRTERGEVELRFPSNRPLPAQNAIVEVRPPVQQPAVKEPQLTLRLMPNTNPESDSAPTKAPPQSLTSRPPSYNPTAFSQQAGNAASLSLPQVGQSYHLQPLAPAQIPDIRLPQMPASIHNLIKSALFSNKAISSPTLPQSATAIHQSVATIRPTPNIPTHHSLNLPASQPAPTNTQNMAPSLVGSTGQAAPSPEVLAAMKMLQTSFSNFLPESPSTSKAPLSFSPSAGFSQGLPQRMSLSPLPVSADRPAPASGISQTASLSLLSTGPAHDRPASFATPEVRPSLLVSGRASGPKTVHLPALGKHLKTAQDLPLQMLRPSGPILTSPGQILQPGHFIADHISMPQRSSDQFAGRPPPVTGNVIGATPQQKPVLALFQGPVKSAAYFILQNSPPLPPGTHLSFGAEPASSPHQNSSSNIAFTQNTPTPLPASLPALLTPGTWPALEEILQNLQISAPQIVQNTANLLPAPTSQPQQLGPALLFFIAAMRSGDIGSWLGEQAQEILRRTGKSDPLSRLGQDMANINRAANEPLNNDWRGLAFPLLGEHDVHKVALFYRREDTPSEENAGLRQTRFIFDMDLTRMGAVQLDGLFQQQRLDLVLRTEAPFSEVMRQQLRHNLSEVMHLSGLSGELQFQNGREEFIKIMSADQSFQFST